jgi:cytidylate kinase
MAHRVVCISRTLAAGGELIGQSVAQRLGFRYVDEEIVSKAAEKAGVDPAVVAAAEHKQPLLKRLLDALASSPMMVDPLASASGLPVSMYFPGGVVPTRPFADDLRSLVRATIVEVAAAGDVVIVAHAASMALAGRDDVLRVLISASADTRARRVAAFQGLAARDANAVIQSSDQERRDYFQRFYDIKAELPTHYDLVVNTDLLTPEQSVSAIVSATQS